MELLIFDLDGTLIDTMPGYAEIAARTLARHTGLDFNVGKELYLRTSGNPFFMQVQEIVPEGKGDRSRINEEFEKEKAVYFTERLLHKGLSSADIHALSTLKKAGKKVCVSSNNYQKLVDEFAEKTPGLFDEALGYRDGFAKGEPHFNYLREKFPLPKSSTCFVGDSLRDAQKAKSSGVPFIGKVGTFSADEFHKHFPLSPLITDLSELLDLSGYHA